MTSTERDPGAVSPPLDEFALDANAVPALLWMTDASGAFIDFNATWLSWRGRTSDEELGDGWIQGVHPHDADRLALEFERSLDGSRVFECDARMCRADGEYRLLALTGVPRHDHEGRFAGLSGACLDITDHVPPRDVVEPSLDLHRAAVDALGEGVVITDGEGCVLTINAAAASMIGVAAEDVVGLPLSGVSGADVVSEAGEQIRHHVWPAHEVLRTGEPVSGAVLGFAAGGEPVRWSLINSRPLHIPETTELLGTVTSIVDITARKVMADAADHRARHDSLTGLANRSELIRTVKSVSSRTQRSGAFVAIAFCDIDDFKSVNDRFGHAAGDELLVVIAQRMAAAVRAGDLVARVGGDELAVVLDGVDGIEDALRVAEQIRASVGAPVVLRAGTVTPTMSIGVSLAGPGQGPAETLNNADLAMYAAKRNGRNAVVSLDPVRPPAQPQAAKKPEMEVTDDARAPGL